MGVGMVVPRPGATEVSGAEPGGTSPRGLRGSGRVEKGRGMIKSVFSIPQIF